MLTQLMARVRGYLTRERFGRDDMAGMYRPLVRGFLAVIAFYYLVCSVFIIPFLESYPVSLVMLPLRISIGVIAILAFRLTRGTPSMLRLELTVLVVGLHLVGNFTVNQSTEFKRDALFTYELILLLMAAASPSLRVFIVTVGATVLAWLGLTQLHSPDILRHQTGVAVAGIVGGTVIWGLINNALASARRAVAIAEQRNDELERFAYICSHDMQEPVRMMHTYSGFLAEATAGRLDEDGQRYLGFIQSNAVRMQAMIRDILAFSRIGREAVTCERVDIAAVVAEVIAENEARIQATGARIDFDDLPCVDTSLTMVRVVLQNLISNGLKFQDGAHPPKVHISAVQDGPVWRIAVRDNGIGIDPAFRGQLFTLFKRLNRKEDYPGTGIGLSTCRKFLRLCGGDIDFTSRPGDGATFFFTLPVRPPA